MFFFIVFILFSAIPTYFQTPSCHPSCATCTSASENHCVSCNSNYYMYSSLCQTSCPDPLTFPNDLTNTCDSCAAQCGSCDGPTANDCLSCPSNYFLNIDGTCVAQCSGATYPDNVQIKCLACDSSCLTCEGGGQNQCLTCVDGRFFYNNICYEQCPEMTYGDQSAMLCADCESSCQTCENDSQCVTCKTNLYKNLETNLCVADCPDNTYKDNSAYECKNCDDSCETCENDHECLTCKTNLFKNLQTLLCAADCPDYTFKDNSAYECKNCEDSCETCENDHECLTCNTDLYKNLETNLCAADCPVNTFKDNSVYECRDCDASCETCENDHECLTCKPSLYKSSSTPLCVAVCESNQYPDLTDNICLPCDSSCLTCTGPSPSDCSSCSSNNFLSNTNTCVSDCSFYFYGDISDNKCKECDSSCITCTGPTSYDCELCSPGYEKVDSRCQKICSQNEYYDSASNICVGCSSPCLTCTSWTFCLSCEDGYFLTPNNECLSFCPNSYYPDSATNTCKICDISCLNCHGDTNENCDACATGYSFNSQNVCLLDCGDNQYFDYEEMVCKNCVFPCETCNSIHECLTCSSNYFLATNQTCLIDCGEGFYADVENKQCDSCIIDYCANCSESISICKSCIEGYSLFSGKCFKNCEKSQYFDTLIEKCQSCDSSCLTCNGGDYNNCLSCNNTISYLKNSMCLPRCNTSSYYDSINRVCQSCNETCYRCNGPFYTSCTECYSGMFLKDFMCVSTCNSNEYSDNLFKECIECDASCASCNGIKNTSCTKCSYITKYLYNGSCLDDCPDGFSKNSQLMICEKDIIVKPEISYFVKEIENPYRFLIIFTYEGLNLTFNFNTSIKQEIILAPIIRILNFESEFSYDLLASGINASSFILDLKYNNATDNLSSSPLQSTATYLQISFVESSYNSYFQLPNTIIEVKLQDFHTVCTNDEYYYDNTTKKCESKKKIYFVLNYGPENTKIKLQFSYMTEEIKQIILSKNLMILEIDDFSEYLDFNYTITSIDALNFLLNFQFYKEIIGGAYLHCRLDTALSLLLNYENPKILLINTEKSLKLLDFYFLSETTQAIVNQTKDLASYGAQATNAAVYSSFLLSPGSSVAIRGLLLLNLIQLLKFIEVNFPSNVQEIFQSSEEKMFLKEKLIDNQDQDSSIPTLFVLYNISGSLINNLGEDFIVFSLVLVLGMIIAWMISLKLKMKAVEFFIKIFKAIFIWSLTIILFLGKYIKVCIFLFIFMKYSFSAQYDYYDFGCAIFCLMFVIMFPLHIFFVLRKIEIFPEVEPNNKVYTNTNANEKTIPCNNNKIFPTITTVDKTVEDTTHNKNSADTATIYSSEIFSAIKLKIKKNQISPFIRTSIEPRNFIIDNNDNNENNNSNNTTYNNENSHKIIGNNADEYLASSQRKIIASNNVAAKLDLKMWNIQEIEEENVNTPRVIKQKMSTMPINIADYNGDNWSSLTKEPYKVKSSLAMSSPEKLNKETHQKIAISAFAPTVIEPTTSKTHNNTVIKPNVWEKYGKIIINFFLRPLNSIKLYIYSVYHPKDPKDFAFRYRILVKGLKKHIKLCKFYFFIDLLRYLFVTLSAIMFIGWNFAQILLMQIVCLFFFLYVIKYQPYENKIDRILSYCKEFLVNISFFMGFLFVYYDGNPEITSENRINMGWCIVFSYLALMYSLILNMLVKYIRLLIFLVRLMFAKLKKN